MDVLTLGGIVFDNYSTPSNMMGGGNQAMVIHKLGGGGRVIDTLGPDDADIVWGGEFFGDNAYSTAMALDAMRAAGQVLPLTWGGQFRSVIISNYIYKVRRLPVWVSYEIACTVKQNPMLGPLGAVATSVESLIVSDLAMAAGL